MTQPMRALSKVTYFVGILCILFLLALLNLLEKRKEIFYFILWCLVWAVLLVVGSYFALVFDPRLRG